MIDPATKQEWLASLRSQPRPTIIPLLIWLGIIGCVGWLFHYIAGHA